MKSYFGKCCWEWGGNIVEWNMNIYFVFFDFFIVLIF